MEALVALTVFAIGTLMIVPTIFAWVQANNVSMQRDAAGRVLESRAADLSQMAPDVSPWTNQAGTADDSSQARGHLTAITASDLNDLGSVARPDVGLNASVKYAVVGITDSGGNLLSRVMRLRVEWDGPGGNRLAEEQWLQR